MRTRRALLAASLPLVATRTASTLPNNNNSASSSSGESGGQRQRRSADAAQPLRQLRQWPQRRWRAVLAGLVITCCGFWMMWRLFLGYFGHLQVHSWLAGPAESAEWLLLLHITDHAHLADLFASFEAQRTINPGMNFFDFVDQQQPDWCSTPNFSRDEVITTIAQFVATNPASKVHSTMCAGVDASDDTFGVSGDGSSGLTPAQRRIESLMRIIPGANGGLSRPFVMAEQQTQRGHLQQQPQEGNGTSQPSSQDHGQACTEGFVNPDEAPKDLPKDSSAL